MELNSMNIKDTKIAKHLNIGLYNFLWTIGAFLFIAGGAWVATQDDIEGNTVFGQETRTIVVKHIDDTKGEPLSKLQIQNKVENIEDDVADLSIKTNKHEDSIVVLDRDMAVQKVQYENIINKLDELIKKGD